MYGLEVPELFAAGGVDSDNAVGVDVAAEAIASVASEAEPVVANTMPRFSSIETPPQAFAPPAFWYASLGQVS
jgi:hypothetical protein